MKNASDVALTDGRFRIIEIYPAYQGEGTLLGAPSLFVRFAGCTVGCKWCDTKFSWKADQGLSFTPSKLADEIFLRNVPHVVLTGGEPFEQPHHMLAELHETLNIVRNITHITYETSGISFPHGEWIKETHQELLFSVSPKLPSAQMNYEFPHLVPWIMLPTISINSSTQLKFVIGANGEMQADIDVVFTQLKRLESVVPYAFARTPIILQPCTPFIRGGTVEEYSKQIAWRTLRLQEWLYEHKWTNNFPNIRVIPQFHAMLHGSKRGI